MCLFCKIINNEIPSYKVYEDDSFISILDISQATKGHTLVIPKKHYDNLLSVSDEDASKMLIVVKNVANQLQKKFNAKGFNIVCNNGEIAGQTINHLHFHIIPRYDNDNFHIEMKENHFDLEEIFNNICQSS